MGALRTAGMWAAGILAVGFTVKSCVTGILPDDRESDPQATEEVEPAGPSYERRVARDVGRSFVDVIAGIAEGAIEAVGGLVSENGETIDVYRDEAGRIFNEAGERLGINLDGSVSPIEDCRRNVDCAGSNGIHVSIIDGKVIGYEDENGNYISLEDNSPSFDYNPPE